MAERNADWLTTYRKINKEPLVAETRLLCRATTAAPLVPQQTRSMMTDVLRLPLYRLAHVCTTSRTSSCTHGGEGQIKTLTELVFRLASMPKSICACLLCVRFMHLRTDYEF